MPCAMAALLSVNVGPSSTASRRDPDIYPDEASRGFSRIWQSDPRALEAKFGAASPILSAKIPLALGGAVFSPLHRPAVCKTWGSQGS